VATTRGLVARQRLWPSALPCHARNLAYIDRMDAKIRYCQRLKLQTGLARVLEVVADNEAKGILPDRTTVDLTA
jgi:hypothetical protein